MLLPDGTVEPCRILTRHPALTPLSRKIVYPGSCRFRTGTRSDAGLCRSACLRTIPRPMLAPMCPFHCRLLPRRRHRSLPLLHFRARAVQGRSGLYGPVRCAWAPPSDQAQRHQDCSGTPSSIHHSRTLARLELCRASFLALRSRTLVLVWRCIPLPICAAVLGNRRAFHRYK